MYFPKALVWNELVWNEFKQTLLNFKLDWLFQFSVFVNVVPLCNSYLCIAQKADLSASNFFD